MGDYCEWLQKPRWPLSPVPTGSVTLRNRPVNGDGSVSVCQFESFAQVSNEGLETGKKTASDRDGSVKTDGGSSGNLA